MGGGLPRHLRFKNFVCQNERIWTLRGGMCWECPPDPPMLMVITWFTLCLLLVQSCYSWKWQQGQIMICDIRSSPTELAKWDRNAMQCGIFILPWKIHQNSGRFIVISTVASEFPSKESNLTSYWLHEVFLLLSYCGCSHELKSTICLHVFGIQSWSCISLQYDSRIRQLKICFISVSFLF